MLRKLSRSRLLCAAPVCSVLIPSCGRTCFPSKTPAASAGLHMYVLHPNLHHRLLSTTSHNFARKMRRVTPHGNEEEIEIDGESLGITESELVKMLEMGWSDDKIQNFIASKMVETGQNSEMSLAEDSTNSDATDSNRTHEEDTLREPDIQSYENIREVDMNPNYKKIGQEKVNKFKLGALPSKEDEPPSLTLRQQRVAGVIYRELIAAVQRGELGEELLTCGVEFSNVYISKSFRHATIYWHSPEGDDEYIASLLDSANHIVKRNITYRLNFRRSLSVKFVHYQKNHEESMNLLMDELEQEMKANEIPMSKDKSRHLLN
eukprot:m.121559 g.121559  ORF g.121559 m.121559 type:complete len:320 (+) comp14401_c0_seq5:195-1154(+)